MTRGTQTHRLRRVPSPLVAPYAKRRVLPQYVRGRTPAGLVDLTAIPFGQRRKARRPDWANFHFLRDPRTQHPNVRITFARLRWRLLDPLRPRECSSCDGRQYQ